jgi:hypothetical protein
MCLFSPIVGAGNMRVGKEIESKNARSSKGVCGMDKDTTKEKPR